MDSFLGAVSKYGVPSRVRTDHGGENNAVCIMMNIFIGFHSGSALRGRSTHNQRIERLWGDLWRGLSNVYYDLFSFLESEGIIDIDNERHMFALHYVYLPRLNRDLASFVDQWNNHGLRTEQHATHLQIFVQGCLERQGQTTTAMQSVYGEGQEGPAEGQGTGAGRLDWPERVTVPPNQFILTDAHLQELSTRWDPLAGRRTDLGLETLRAVVSFVDSFRI